MFQLHTTEIEGRIVECIFQFMFYKQNSVAHNLSLYLNIDRNSCI